MTMQRAAVTVRALRDGEGKERELDGIQESF